MHYMYSDKLLDVDCSLSKFGGLGTFEQLMHGHKIEKVHVMVGSKLFRKCFHRYLVSLFLILVGCSLMSMIGKMFQILGKRLK